MEKIVIGGNENMITFQEGTDLDDECEEEHLLCDKEKCGDVIENDIDGQSLVGMTVKSEEEAYELYNDYAYKMGFSIRKHKQKFKAGNKIKYMKQFVCQRQGKKSEKGKVNKCYSKIDIRTGCKASIQFRLNDEGIWTVTMHERTHNHDLCPENQRHLMRSQRAVTKNNVNYLQELKNSGVCVAAGLRVLKKQAGGSPFIGFTSRDAYNSLALLKGKELDGGDSNALIEIFKWRKENEEDFYYDFEIDSSSSLCSFYWRDGRMKRDYDLFGDLLVNDTIYRTNKYDMICGPFVGMDNHCKNVMFGCGFLMNEKTESFIWLFNTFLKSMGGKHPITLMTDQSAAMAAAIREVFPRTRHRLCIWHIGENSKKNIKGLRCKEGFVDLFNYLLKYIDTEAEFEFYWARLMNQFDCHNDTWLGKLYSMREKWCPAFSKDYFSGGVLSSQRSETTNHSISKRLSKTSTLCDFYHSFVDVIAEWRSNENAEDFRCNQGRVEIAVSNSKLLKHANEIYTIEAYLLFEEQFMKFPSYCQDCVLSSNNDYVYQIWCPDVDAIRHTVYYNQDMLAVTCTCKMYTEVGILCSHCLRVFNMHCVQVIPDQYILKRWAKDVVASSSSIVDSTHKMNSEENVASSVWRRQMIRKFSYLISASEMNKKAREYVDEGFKMMRDSVVTEVGSFYMNESEDDGLSSNVNVRDPIGSRAKGERNIRKKSIVEKRSNQAKGRKRNSKMAAARTITAVHLSMKEKLGSVMGTLVHPSNNEDNLGVLMPSSSHVVLPDTSQSVRNVS